MDSKKEKILECALEVFARDGFHKAKTDEIAERAGVAKGSVYYHFKNKETLLVESAKQGVKFIDKEVDTILEKDMPPNIILKSLLGVYVEIYIDYPKISGLLFNGNHEGLKEDTISQLQEIKKQIIGKLSKLIDEGIKYNVIRDLNPEFCAYAIWGIINSICGLNNESNKLSKEQVTNSIYEILNNGIFKGEK